MNSQDPISNIEAKAEELALEERRKTPLPERFAKNGFRIRTCGEALAEKPVQSEPLVEGACKRASIHEIISVPKRGKTFFGMQFGCCLSSGIPFLGHRIPRPLKTLYVNLELSSQDFDLRLWNMREALGLQDNELLNENLIVLHARGRGLEVREKLIDMVRDSDLDVVILDTRYKLHAPGESENTPEGLAGVIDFQDQLAECGLLVVVIGHDPKGNPGDRQIVDRGAGSNWASRDYDSRWVLTPHDKDPVHTSVLSASYRSFPNVADKSIVLTDKLVFELSDAPAIPQTSYSPSFARKTPPASVHEDAIVDIVEKAGKPLPKGVVVEKLREEVGIGEKAARKAVDVAVADGAVKETNRRHERNGCKLIGIPEQLDLMDYIDKVNKEAEQG